MIYRIDVRSAPTARGGEAAADPLGEAVRHQIQEFGASVGPVATSRIFLIDTPASRQQMARAAHELLSDPIVEQATIFDGHIDDEGHSRIEIHLKPGVMDPVAASTEMALRDMGMDVNEVRTGRAYRIEGKIPRNELQRIASRVLANGVIESIHFEPLVPKRFETGREYRFELRHVPLTKLSDPELAKLSRGAHLFLSPAEMKAIQDYFRQQRREPTDVELETLAQTWSEHCVHKTLKSAVDVEVREISGRVLETRHYDNLIRDTIFKSTMDLIRGTGYQPVEGIQNHGPVAHATKKDFCLSVFADNAGVISFDETDAVCFKVETHNHPSAIEPYGGSATGIGGVIRDILGTGLAARPFANTDVFCVAFPDREPASIPAGAIHPKRVLRQVVAGVRDYGNRMGIPTVNGAVYFDDRYVGNPLVFCGCVGLIPHNKIEKRPRAGDAIVVMGGRTGRDGIHGATFSSAELTGTHADEFSHAVQIGNAITEKKMADIILQARDRGLFTAITDCGAGGLSSAVGEMGENLGAFVELDKVPLKYAGLRYDEIWISEAQERMVLAAPPEKLDDLLNLSASEDVEATVIGHFGTEKKELVLNFRGQEVGRLSMDFLHQGLPMPRRKAIVVEPSRGTGYQPVSFGAGHERSNIKDRLLTLLAHPNIASKHWIIRQYDHEVQGGSVIKPLTGPLQTGPSDAAVVRPKLDSYHGVAIGCGLAPHIDDPYEMALAAIDEAIRNVVAVGAAPDRIALLDNFCWPSVDDERTMGSLVRACESCHDAALAYGTPFISGKDSLHNQFTDGQTGQVIRIPNTLLISAIGVIDDVRKCVTMDLKSPDNVLALVKPSGDGLAARAEVHRKLADLLRLGQVVSCHDCSEGGAAVALAEMCIGSGLGAEARFAGGQDVFADSTASYIVECTLQGRDQITRAFRESQVSFVGDVKRDPLLRLSVGPESAEISVDELRSAWTRTLDW